MHTGPGQPQAEGLSHLCLQECLLIKIVARGQCVVSISISFAAIVPLRGTWHLLGQTLFGAPSPDRRRGTPHAANCAKRPGITSAHSQTPFDRSVSFISVMVRTRTRRLDQCLICRTGPHFTAGARAACKSKEQFTLQDGDDGDKADRARCPVRCCANPGAGKVQRSCGLHTLQGLAQIHNFALCSTPVTL